MGTDNNRVCVKTWLNSLIFDLLQHNKPTKYQKPNLVMTWLFKCKHNK